MTLSTSRFLRWVLLVDAVLTGATALLMTFAAPVLADVLRLPVSLLLAAGIVLIPYAALVAYLGTRARVRASTIWALIVCNLLWGIDCAFVAFSGWVEPSALGYAFIAVQVVVVIAFAELQYTALRRFPVTV